jgi:hypothetical protein
MTKLELPTEMAIPDTVAWSPGFKVLVPAIMALVPVMVNVSEVTSTVTTTVLGAIGSLSGKATGAVL